MNIEDLTVDCPECQGKGYHVLTDEYKQMYNQLYNNLNTQLTMDMYGYGPYYKEGELVKYCRFCKSGKIPSEEGKQLLEFLRLHINWRYS